MTLVLVVTTNVLHVSAIGTPVLLMACDVSRVGQTLHTTRLMLPMTMSYVVLIGRVIVGSHRHRANRSPLKVLPAADQYDFTTLNSDRRIEHPPRIPAL